VRKGPRAYSNDKSHSKPLTCLFSLRQILVEVTEKYSFVIDLKKDGESGAKTGFSHELNEATG